LPLNTTFSAKKTGLWLVRILLRIIPVILAILFTLALLLNIPAVQTYVAAIVANKLTQKLGTEIRVDRVKIALPATVMLDEIYVEGNASDTLLYVERIFVSVEIFKLIQQNVKFKELEIEGLVSHIHRKAPANQFNFQFIIDAFASSDTLSVADTLPSQPWSVDIGTISLKNFYASYFDDVAGLNAVIHLGKLTLNMEETNLDQLIFKIEDIDIQNSMAFLKQWEVKLINETESHSEAEIENAEEDLLPQIALGSLNLENLQLRYIDTSVSQDFSVALGSLQFSPEKIDLNNRRLDLGSLKIAATSVEATLDSGASAERETNNEKSDPVSIFPDWNITMSQLVLDRIDVKYDDIAAPITTTGLDFSHPVITGLSLLTDDIEISPEGISAFIRNISFDEKSGFGVAQFAAQVNFSEKETSISSLILKAEQTELSGSFKAGYLSVEDFLKDPGSATVNLGLEKLKINTRDILYFMPELEKDSIFRAYLGQIITAKLTADGMINNLKVNNFELSSLTRTRVRISGSIKGLPDFSNPHLNLSVAPLTTSFSDLSKIAGISLPETVSPEEKISLRASFIGALSDFDAELSIVSPFGNLSSNAFFQKKDSLTRDTFQLNFEANNLMAGKMLADTTIGSISFTGQVSGSGSTSDSIAALANITVSEAVYNKYHYKGLEISGLISGGNVSARVSSPDPNINFDLQANAELKTEGLKFSIDMIVNSLNLFVINFLKEELVISTKVAASASIGDGDHLKAKLNLADVSLSKERSEAIVNALEVNALVTDSIFDFELTSDPLDASVTGNFNPDSLEQILSSMMRQYFGLQDSAGILPGTRLAFSLDLHLSENLKKFISDKFDISDRVSMKGSYTGDDNALDIEMRIPSVSFGAAKLDTLYMLIKGKDQVLDLDFDFRTISYDTISISNFNINQTVNSGRLISSIKIAGNRESPKFLFSNQIIYTDTLLRISFLPDGLILDDKPWKIVEDNYLQISREKMDMHNFTFSRDNQSFGLAAVNGNTELVFREFGLGNVFNILDLTDDIDLLKGKLDGTATFDKQDINLDMKLDSLCFMDIFAGNIAFHAKGDSSAFYLDVLAENAGNIASLRGEVFNYNESPDLDLYLQLDLTNLQALEELLDEEISELGGKIKSEISIRGKTENPAANGFIDFQAARFRINSLNFLVNLPGERISIVNNEVRFDNFTLEDVQQNKLTLDGVVSSADFTDVNFDLRIIAKEFRPVSSTAADNPTFYGDLVIDTDLKIKGNQNSPEVDAYLKIGKGTNLTYVLPGSEIKLITPEGIVQFVDRSLAVDSLAADAVGDYLTDSIISRISGIDLATNLEIHPDAVFTVIIDPRSGDYLSIGGSAVLSFAVDKSGSQSLSGIFEVKSGLYQLSFYGLVRKTFSFQPGSNISWSGKPMDASLGIVAAYEVTTNSVALVSNESTSMSESEKNLYKNRLPYTVLLNINGFLSQPEISFNITLPEREMVNYPQVASKLGQLNTPEMESERNKQVFALLVTGSFIADNPYASTGSSTSAVATTAARNSVNGILTDQMNKLSGKYIKNVDLNFGLNSYEDYAGEASQVQTELEVTVSKKLFNDRLTVEASGYFDVDGNTSTSYTGQSSKESWGEFAATYALDQSGRHKVRVYRENAYDLFDGEVVASGFSFILEREFESLRRKSKRAAHQPKYFAPVSNEGLKSKEPIPEDR